MIFFENAPFRGIHAVSMIAGASSHLHLARARCPAPIGELPPGHRTPLNRIWMIILRGYLLVAGCLVRIVQLATGNH